MENDGEVIKRLLIFLGQVATSHQGKTILVVSHASLIKALLVHLEFARHDQLEHGAIKNTAYIKLKFDGVKFFLEETKGITKK